MRPYNTAPLADQCAPLHYAANFDERENVDNNVRIRLGSNGDTWTDESARRSSALTLSMLAAAGAKAGRCKLKPVEVRVESAWNKHLLTKM